jgi:hypothetical protein
MNENLKEIKSGALKKLGEHLMSIVLGVIGAICIAAWLYGKKLWAWWKGFSFPPELMSRIEFWLAIFIGAVVVLIVLIFIIGLLNRNNELQNLLKAQQSPPPNEPLRKNPWSGTDSVGRFIERPSEMAFHVLKFFYLSNPNGALNVMSISGHCNLSEDDVRYSLKELRDLGFIRTDIPGPGEWNGYYAITDSGRRHIAQHAT